MDAAAQEYDDFTREAMARRDATAAEIEASQAAHKAKERKRERVYRISSTVQGMIQEAVQARESSGIEARWREDLIYYYGSSDIVRSLRGVIDAALADKARPGEGGRDRPTRSTISVNITRPKVNAAFSRLSDMLLPVDDRNFAIEPTPQPDMSERTMQEKPDDLVAGPGQTGAVVTAKQRADMLIERVKKSAAAMQKEIDDNLTECDYNSEMRKALFQATCLGTGIVKGPVAAQHTERAWRELDGEWTMDTKETVTPESRWVDIFNAYPDPAANGIVKNMRYFVERDEYNARMLRGLRNQPGYLTDIIDEVLSAPPQSIKRTKTERQVVDGSYNAEDTQMYEVFIVTCELTKGALDDLGVLGLGGCVDGEDGERAYLPCPESNREDPIGACVVMCNGKPIKAYINPLAGGDLGYDVFCYEPVHGQTFGLGVAYLLRSPQRVLSTTWRMIMDNAALTVGGMIVVERDGIEPADGTWSLYGGKVFYKTEKFADGKGGKVEDAFKVYSMESRLAELEKIIALAMKFAEDETSLPSLMEGNQGAAPDTVGGMTLLMNSANTVLKMLAKRFDDSITKPHIGRYYDWHMLYSEKNEIKGDFNVKARGSSHLVVRDLQRQSLIGFMQYAMNPQLAVFFKTGGYDALRKTAEANHISPDDVLISETEAPDAWKAWQQMQMAIAQAKNGGGDKGGGEAEKLKFEAEDRERQRAHDMRMREMDYNTKLMEMAQAEKVSIADIKARLADKVMDRAHKETMQARELAHAEASPTHQGI